MTAPRSADVVVCGAGIVGVAVAHHLSAVLGVPRVLVADPLPPLGLTSSMSTECYRNWWPSPEMVGLTNRSIDLLEHLAATSGDRFSMNRRGYLYVTADEARFEAMASEARRITAMGAGDLRVHPGPAHYRASPTSAIEGVPDGADLIGSPALLHRLFPWLAREAVGALHVRRAGWLSAQQLGAVLLEGARSAGASLLRDRVVAVEVERGRVARVRLEREGRVATPAVVVAVGPLLGRFVEAMGLALPVRTEVHRKVAFPDPLGAFPRDAPLVVWNDPQRLGWSHGERRELERVGRDDLLGELPPGCHGRPEGGADSPWVLALWEYRREVIEPVWPLPSDPMYAEAAIRGMGRAVPGLLAYLTSFPRTVVDGGYYTKAPDNRPLIGPLGPEGAFVCGAVSGYGVMAAAAAGELAALHVTGGHLPWYADALLPSRFEDPVYVEALDPADSGQI